MRHLPYLVGGFMLLPLVIWAVLRLTLFSGPNHGLDVPLAAALLATSLPLAAWFLLANLGFLANSMGGADAFDRPRARWVRAIVAALPWAALSAGLLSLPFLVLQGEVSALMALPPLSGLVIFLAIRRGEAARSAERGGRWRLAAEAGSTASAPAGRTALQRSVDLGLELVYRVPVIGWLIADAVKGRASAKLFFAFNCTVVWLAAIALFGYPAIILPALALVPLIFAGLFATTRM